MGDLKSKCINSILSCKELPDKEKSMLVDTLSKRSHRYYFDCYNYDGKLFYHSTDGDDFLLVLSKDSSDNQVHIEELHGLELVISSKPKRGRLRTYKFVS